MFGSVMACELIVRLACMLDGARSSIDSHATSQHADRRRSPEPLPWKPDDERAQLLVAQRHRVPLVRLPRRTGHGAAAVRTATVQSRRAPTLSSGSLGDWRRGRRDGRARSPNTFTTRASAVSVPARMSSGSTPATPHRCGSPEQFPQPQRTRPGRRPPRPSWLVRST